MSSEWILSNSVPVKEENKLSKNHRKNSMCEYLKKYEEFFNRGKFF